MDNVLSSIAGAIGSFAPTLATMLGGPLAGTAVTALEGVLGVKGSDKINSLLKAQQLTPEQMGAISAEDNKHKEVMGQQGIDLEKLNVDFQTHMIDADNSDRNSARIRESNVKDWTPKILAGLVVVATFGLEAAVLFHGTPKDMDQVVLGRILGTLDTALALVLAYYFGSSSGATRGQELLAQSGPVSGASMQVTSK